MDDSHQLSEKLKNFPIEQILIKDSYIELLINDNWNQGYIKEIKPNNKYDIIAINNSDKIVNKNNLTTKEIAFLGSHIFQNNNNLREIYLNEKLKDIEIDNLNSLILEKLTEINIDVNIINKEIDKINIENEINIINIPELEKNNPALLIKDSTDNEFNITGYYTMQFFSGFFIDIIVYINNQLSNKLKESVEKSSEMSLEENLKQLINLILNMGIYVLSLLKNNSKKIREYIQINKKIILIDKIISIINSSDIILTNILLIFCYKFYNYPDIEKKLVIISNICYDIIINNENNEIPMQLFFTLINFITYEDNVIRITNFDKNKLYKAFLHMIKNITETDIKYIKNISDIRNYCSTIIRKLYKKEIKVLINNCYYNFLINCLTKFDILEKKIAALNCINDIILYFFDKENELNPIFYDFFFKKNKILNIFFEETVHNEILKRSVELFKYLSTYEKISNEIINILIKLENNNHNNIVRNILCEIIKRIKTIEEKTDLFTRITNNFNFDDNDNQNNIIDFVTKLTIACFNSQEHKADIENDLTNGNSSYEESFNERNLFNDNASKRSNIQIIRLPGMLKNNSSFRINKISRNVSNKSIERSNIDRRDNNHRINNFKKQTYKKKNYFGLDMLFKYILYTYDSKKALENNNLNISKAIKAFIYILDMTNNVIKMTDLYYFLNELFENIQTNKKNNSAVQSLILIEILLKKLQRPNEKNEPNGLTNNRYSSVSNINCEDNEIVKILDEKYDIITLISNDLIRYVNDVKVICDRDKSKKKNYKENIFEGIYNYKDNISIRLKLLFFFEYFDLNINTEHIKKLYNLFKNEESKEEKLLLFTEISNNIIYFNMQTLNKMFTEIFQDKNEFDISTLDEEDIFLLIKEIIFAINLEKHTLLDDSKVIKVNAELNKLQGVDFLFNMLISNRNAIIIKRICNMLTHFCYFLVTYKKEYPSRYWNSFINKITDFMEVCNKTNNIEGIYALAILTEALYHYDFAFKIPGKEDVHEIKDTFFVYQFSCPDRENKSYKLKVGKNDKFYLMRWKLAYYFDLHVNDVVISDLDGKKYNLLYDEEKFEDIFPIKKYHKNVIQFELIKVYEIPNQILSVHNNPSELIEKNEKIINILIDNLKNDKNIINNNENKNETNNDIFEIKKEIWNILEKLPKQKYSQLLINKFDSKKLLTEEELKTIINFEEIFALTYNLQCIIKDLSNDKEKEKDKEKSIEKQKQINVFLNTFTNIYHIDKMLYLNFIKRDINKLLKDENTQFIYYEYIKYLLIIMQIIEDYKRKKYITINSNTLNEGRDTIQSKHELDLDVTKLHSLADLKDSILDITGSKPLFDKITDIIVFILNDTSTDNDSICFEIIQEIVKLVDNLKNIYNIINNNYFEFIFDNDILFKKIFIYDFIKSQKNEVKNLLSNFLLKNLFENHNSVNNLRYNSEEGIGDKKEHENKNLKTFFEIILSPEIFSFLLNNQKDGSYFILLSSLIEKYINSKKKIINILNSQKDIKNIIDLIITSLRDKNNIETNNDICLLNYPYNNSGNTSISKTSTLTKNDFDEKDKNDFINGILLYLLRILQLSEECNPIIDYFLNKIDVCNFFLMRGIFNKCNKNPLSSDDTTYSDFNSHKNIYQLIIFILKYLDNTKKIIEGKNYLNDCLYMKIWQILNKYHKLEFWRKNKNFDMNFNDRDRKEFIGLKNMSSTCYMNSILQQFFMIPMLRETLLSINNDKQDTILYQLQLTFSALKAYEFKYYDPKYFVTVSNLSFFEQMDADEYYGLLVDKLETDINNLNKIEIDTKNLNYKNLFKFFFGIKLTDELYFVECDHKRYNESFYYNIQLEVKNYNNINDSLKNYFKTEIMNGDNKIICEECKTKRICHKKLKLKSLPNILVISLKRFDYDYRNMTKFKLNNYFEFPFELNLSEYLIKDKESSEKNKNENNLYELTGITIHYGVSDYGHYYDLIKAVNNKWYKFNDTYISEFSENDIPREAFGDKENENIDLEEDITTNKAEIKEKDNKNAYILIYTKKGFNNDSKKYLNNEYNAKLVFPPYNKLSNINQSMKSYINYKIFKYWCLENLSDANYQNFILELLKLDLVKNINMEIAGTHYALIDNLRQGNYLPIKNYINTGITIFSFGLLFCCNILNRCPKEKNISHLFEDIIIVYLENDPKKCLYVLEEFSNFDIINEFIFSCEKESVSKEMIELVSVAFNNLFSFIESNEEIRDKYLIQLTKYLNTIILFIEKEKNFGIKNLSSFDNIMQLLYKLIYKKRACMDYIKKKNIDKWLEEIINMIEKRQNEGVNTIDSKNNEVFKNLEEIQKNNIINEINLPKLESNHCILLENTNDFNFGFQFNEKIEIKGIKSKNIIKKSYDGFAFIKILLEDLRDMK